MFQVQIRELAIEFLPDALLYHTTLWPLRLLFPNMVTDILTATVLSRSCQAYRYILSYFTSSVTIDSDDHAFDALEDWLEGRRIYNDATSYQAVSAFDEEENLDSDNTSDSNRGKNVSNGMSAHQFRYEPRCGIMFMFYKGHVVFIKKSTGKRDGKITLSCFGRSAGVVKAILSEASRNYIDSGNLVTVIRRAYRGSWSDTSTKTQRSIHSVSIDAAEKAMLLKDVDGYVADDADAWYGARGVPYRRGYLFYGLPGTGKSSLAMAIAGRTKRDIYTIALVDEYMDDSTLLRLMKGVPNRSIILFEDIDSAGLVRETAEDDPDDRPRKTHVTLSGLLNAIDGVESPEGHLLIMTTNHIDALNEALIRCGRVSRRIAFKLTSPAQAKEIFLRMMQADVYVAPSQRIDVASIDPEHAALIRLATEFADNIPDNTFSPADLQDFLLMHKSEPQSAVAELEGWKVGKLREQAERKAIEEQKALQKEMKEQEERDKKFRISETARLQQENIHRVWQEEKRAIAKLEAEKAKEDKQEDEDTKAGDAGAKIVRPEGGKCHVM